jgi:myo-inositol-1(or 4)-monophosphatase
MRRRPATPRPRPARISAHRVFQVEVASGRFDATIMLSNKPWDTAAGVIIAREAGAEVVDKDGSHHDLRSSGTVAASAILLPRILDLLAQAARACS